MCVIDMILPGALFFLFTHSWPALQRTYRDTARANPGSVVIVVVVVVVVVFGGGFVTVVAVCCN